MDYSGLPNKAPANKSQLPPFDIALAPGEDPEEVAARITKQGLPKKIDYAKLPDKGDNWYKKVIGRQEAALSTVSGGLSWIPGGIVKAAGIVSGQTKEGIELGDTVQKALTYEPRTEYGKELVGAVAAPFEAISKGAQQAGDWVYDKTGSPLLGAAAKTAVEAIPFVAPPVIGKGIKGAKGAVRSLERDLGGIIPEQQGKPYAITPEVKFDYSKLPDKTAEAPKLQEVEPIEVSTRPEIVQPRASSQEIAGKPVDKGFTEVKGVELSKAEQPRVETVTEPSEVKAAPEIIETKTAKAALDINKALAEKGFAELPESELAQYPTQTRSAVVEKVTDVLNSDMNKAYDMALGKEPTPEGVSRQVLFNAVKSDAYLKGNSQVLLDLAKSPIATERSLLAQKLGEAGYNNAFDPVKDIQDIAKAREEVSQRTGKKTAPEEVERLQKQLDETQKAFDDYVAQKTTRTKGEYGSKNKLVTKSDYELVRDELRKQFGSQLNAGLDPTIAAKLTKIGVYHLEAGLRDFKVWSNRIVRELGEWVRPHLQDVWEQANGTYKKEKSAQTASKSAKTRYKNGAQKYTDKLENLDFERPAKNKRMPDAEERRLKAAYDQAKRDYDNAAQLSGTVTKEEVGKLIELSKRAQDLKTKRVVGKGFANEKERMEYGLAQDAYESYVNALKSPDLSLKELAQRRIAEFKQTAKGNVVKAGMDLAKDTIVEIDNNSIALVASLDNSFIGRQGLKTLQTHPSVWTKAALRSFGDIYKALKDKHGNDKAKRILHVDLISREHYMDGTYQKAGILAKFEEQYPTSHPARVPYIGRAFKASEVAFTNSALRMRMGTFDLLYDIAKKNGVEMSELQIKDLGTLVNSATMRAGLKHTSGFLNMIFWAPRMMKAQVNVLTAHGLGAGLKTKFPRQQARINLMKIVASTATVAAVLNAIDPGSVETDPRSSDFLKYRSGNTRIDLTGGSGSYITLLARAWTQQTKSTQTKIIKDLNTGGFGNASVFSVGLDFLTNKTTPLVRQGAYYFKGRNFEGKKPTAGSIAIDLITPIPVKNFVENFYGDYAENTTAAVVGSLVDVVGINANTYHNLQHWDEKDTKQLARLKARVGEERFNQLNVKYNKTVNAKIDAIVETPRYQRMTDEQKKKEIEKIRRIEKRKIIH